MLLAALSLRTAAIQADETIAGSDFPGVMNEADDGARQPIRPQDRTPHVRDIRSPCGAMLCRHCQTKPTERAHACPQLRYRVSSLNVPADESDWRRLEQLLEASQWRPTDSDGALFGPVSSREQIGPADTGEG